MDLEIKDVAELLDVSETTIHCWLTDGKIPAYKLNHQYRFSRIEIENWMIGANLPENKEPVATQRGGLQQFSLYRAIHKGGVFANIAGETKEEIIRATTKMIAPQLGMDVEGLSELLLDREELMSTAMNRGIAVPHTRDLLLKGPFDVVVIVFPERPIEYGALDGEPVHTLFFLFSSTDKSHLQLLAKLAHLSSHGETLQLLRSKPSQSALLEYIRDWESLL